MSPPEYDGVAVFKCDFCESGVHEGQGYVWFPKGERVCELCFAEDALGVVKAFCGAVPGVAEPDHDGCLLPFE
jgi:hypothetical protein